MDVFNNSKNSLWPILGKDFNSKPFIIAAFYGCSKPDYAQECMADFVEEVNILIERGVTIKNMHYNLSIAGMTSDIPARAFLKRCKGHTGVFIVVNGVKSKVLP